MIWRGSFIAPLYKGKGSAAECSNHRDVWIESLDAKDFHGYLRTHFFLSSLLPPGPLSAGELTPGALTRPSTWSGPFGPMPRPPHNVLACSLLISQRPLPAS
eukprot:4475124-Lingulodinium_polyedra.AAC.1